MRATPTAGEIKASALGHIDRQDFAGLQTWLAGIEPDPRDPEQHGWWRYARALTARYCDASPAEAVRLLSENLAQPAALSADLVARSQVFLGNVHGYLGEIDRAIQLNQLAFEHYQRVANAVEMVGILVNQSGNWNDLGEYEQAAACARQAIELNDARGLGPSYRYAYAWNALANAQKNVGDLSGAIPSYEQVIVVGESLRMPHLVAFANHNLAELWLARRDLAKAKAHYRRALEGFSGAHANVAADTRSGLAKIATIEGNLDEAQVWFDEALAQAQATHNVFIAADLHLARAALADKRGDDSRALAETRAAVASVESSRANIALSDERARFGAAHVSAYDQLIARLIGARRLDEAFLAAEQAKARTLLELLRERAGGARQIRRPNNVPQAWLDDEANLRAQLARLYGEAGQDSAIAEREQRLHALRERIRFADAEFGSFQAAQPIGLDQVRARLPDDACLVEFVVAEKADSASVVASAYSDIAGVWAFVVTKRDARTVKLPIAPVQLRSAFRAAGDSSVSRLPHLTPDGAGRLHPPVILPQLHKYLLAPLGDEVARAPLVCVVAHGVLHYVPFHALLPDQTVLYAPSATVLLDHIARKPPAARAGALAVGINHADANRPLTYAEAEAEWVAREAGGDALLGERATRADFVARARDKRFVHVACHANFRAAQPLQSYLQLADGPLDVLDVLHDLELQAELVALSGCDTGLSHVLRGDELIGFARAFLYAGTPSVMLSQWVVEDLSTCLLMRRFYAELVANRTGVARKAEALRVACQALRQLSAADVHDELRELLPNIGAADERVRSLVQALDAMADSPAQTGRVFDHPFYWAAFFMLGDRL